MHNSSVHLKTQIYLWINFCILLGFQGCTSVKNQLAKTGDIRDLGLTPGFGRSLGGEHGNSLQYSWLENPLDRGAWWTVVHRVAKSRTWLKWLSTHTYTASCVLAETCLWLKQRLQTKLTSRFRWWDPTQLFMASVLLSPTHFSLSSPDYSRHFFLPLAYFYF